MGTKGIISGLTDPTEVMFCYENDDFGGGGVGDDNPDAGGELPKWTAGAKAETREKYGEQLKGHESFDAFINNHFETAEKYKNAIFVPGENATPEEKSAYREKMGIPVEASGYELGNPENLPEGMKVDDQMKSWFAEAAFKYGLSKSVAKELFGEFNNLQVSRFNASRAAYKTQKETVEKEMRNTYGDAYEAKLEDGKRAYNKLFDEKTRERLGRMGLGGDPSFLKAMIQISEKVSEDSFSGGSGGGGEPKGDGGLYYENTPGMRIEDQ